LAEWLFDRDAAACLILDGGYVRDDRGTVVGWIDAGNVYLRHGEHVGWFEGGVIYDNTNCALAFSAKRTGYLPNMPRIAGIPGLPKFSAAPANPGFARAPARPGRGDWSRHYAGSYFA
jgi:hypothetical protein